MQYEQISLEGSENSVDFVDPEESEEHSPEGALEAVLFSAGDPIRLSALAEAAGLSEQDTESLLLRIQERYRAREHGIRLIELNGAWQFVTKKQYYPDLIRIASHPAKPRLTDVLLETLSIIAYRQPVTKAEIERIRGVKSDHAVNKLIEYELIKEVGRLNAPGRPILFATTDKFLRNFGLSSTDHLPEPTAVQMEDFREEAEAEIGSGGDMEESEKIRV